jgi:sugar lactone lactonase YvrE
MSHTSYVLADGRGDVYVSDFWANVVIEVLRDGRIVRVAGTGTAGFSGDRGCAVDAELDFPTGLALDTYGRLYISDAFNNRVRMIDHRGIIDTVAGSGPTGPGNGSYSGDGGPASMATLNAPAGLAFDSSDNLYIADQGNDRVRMVSRGIISLVAGMPARAASVAPRGISIPPKGAGSADHC